MRDLLKLKEDTTIAVRFTNPVTSKSEILADLQLRYGQLPVLDHHDHTASVYMRDVKEMEVICVKSGSTRKYKLVGIEDDGFNNHCRYVYTGKADINNIHKVSFIIPELAPYFINELSYQLDADVNLTGKLHIEPMETMVTNEGKSLTIKVHQGYELKRFEEKNGFGFTSKMYVSFESNEPLSFNDIENMMYRATKLFTWITGFPVTADQIDVFDADNSGCLYIPSLIHDKQHDTSDRNSFMHNTLFRENYETICKHYFGVNRTIFENIWSRTIPLFDFSGVLEYELMLFASVLDKYFSYRVKELSLDNKLTDKEHVAFIERLKKRLQDDSELHALVSGNGMSNYANLSGLSKVFPNTSLDSFHKKAKAFLRHIGQYCTEIFINDRELYDIKSIRDRAAHGEIEVFPTDKTIKLLYKLKALTIYLTYRDLGICDDIFLKVFSSTLHPIRMRCEFDHFKLDHKLGRATAIRLNKKNLREFEEYKTFTYVFWLRGEQWTFEKAFSDAISSYFRDPDKPYFKDGGYKSYHEYVQTEVDKVDPSFKARFCNHAYLVINKEQRRLHSVVVIDKQK